MFNFFNSKTYFPITGICFLSVIILSGCAASYTPIKPEARKYTSAYNAPDSSISYAYKYDVLSLMGNKRYSKRERKAGLSVLSVRIQNNTDSAIAGSNLKVFVGNNQVIPVSNQVAANNLKQTVWPYLFYALLNLRLSQGVKIDNGRIEEEFIIIPIGIPIAVGNMIGAGSANVNLRKEFMQYDIMNKSIKPHETTYGIIVLQGL